MNRHINAVYKMNMQQKQRACLLHTTAKRPWRWTFGPKDHCDNIQSFDNRHNLLFAGKFFSLGVLWKMIKNVSGQLTVAKGEGQHKSKPA